MITHVAMWKFDDGSDDLRRQFIDGLNALDGIIPQIRYIKAYESCNEANDFNAVLLVKFNSLADLSLYQKDPRHLAVAQIGKEHRVSRASIDYEES